MAIVLDRSKPLGTTYGDAAANGYAFIQDGLWFRSDGSCDETLPENKAILASRPRPASSHDVAPVTKAGPMTTLESKGAAEIYQMAVSLKALLEEGGAPVSYQPTPAGRDANITFLKENAE